jgi:hypothetical protein
VGPPFPRSDFGGSDPDARKDEPHPPVTDGTDLPGGEHRAMGAEPHAGSAVNEMTEHVVDRVDAGLARSISSAPDPESADALIAFVGDRLRDDDGSGEWLGFALMAFDRKVRESERERLGALGALAIVELEGERLAGAVADRVAERLAAGPSSVPLLADYPEAARLLRTTVSALKTRVSRGDQRLHAAMVTNGRSVRFNVAKLSAKVAPRRIK